MFPKFSVKKPLTVFVGVIIVLILGVISYTRMTPDLLPSMNLPYAIVITAYPGATPEEVEAEITKPMEQAVATLDNIEEITSTSMENVSTVVLSFAEDTNMDTVTSDIREKINTISSGWSELVSTPTIMKINPNMMPVNVAGVTMDGVEITDLTELLDETLLTKLEGIEGVASVSMSGNIEETINVKLSQEKIDEINKRISNALDETFEDAEKEISNGAKEIDDGLKEVEKQEGELNSALDQIESGQDQLINQAADAEAQLIDKKVEIASAKAQITSGLQEIETNLTLIQSTRDMLVSLRENIKSLEAKIGAAEKAIEELVNAQSSYNSLMAEKAELEAELASLPNTAENAERISEINNRLLIINTQISAIESAVKLYGAAIENIQGRIDELTQTIPELQAAIDEITSQLSGINIDANTLDTVINELDGSIAELQSTKNTLNETMKQLETGGITVDAALKELNRQQTSGMLQMSSGVAQITAGQSAIASAKAQLEAGKAQLDEATKELDVQKEAAYKAANLDITIEMLSAILTAQNFSMPAGYIEENDISTLVKIGNKIESLEEMEGLLLFDTGIESVGKIHLKDVADITVDDNSEDMYAKLNGEPGVLLTFSKQSNYSTAVVSDNIQKKFKELSKEYDGLSFTSLMDQGDYIYLIVDSVFENLILGAVFAVIILLLFLKDLRPTFAVGLSIPISLLLAIVLMYFSGVTLNIISLSGLAVGVGMLVDNSVVVIENIYRIRNEGASAAKASVYGAVQVTGSIIASTLTTVCVFLPIVFIDGITRQLFTDMALTIAYSLLASLAVAITLIPAMSSKILRKTKPKEHKWFNKFTNAYGKLAAVSLRHKWVALGLSVLLLFGSVFALLQRGFIFMPSMSGNQISVTVVMNDEDASFKDQSEMMDEISSRILEIEDVETVGSMISASDGSISMLSVADSGMSIYAIIKEDAKLKDSEISKIILDKCADLDCEITAAGSMDLSSYMSSMGGSGVALNIYGDDLDALIKTAEDITEIMEGTEGIAAVEGAIKEATPEIRIVVDKNKAMEKSLTTAQVFQSVSMALSENKSATSITYNDKNEDVVVHSANADSLDLDYLKGLTISATNNMTGETSDVKLADIAEFKHTNSLTSITRSNQRRYVSVSGTVADGKNVNLVTNDVEAALKGYKPASGITIESSGENETIMEAMKQLVLMAIMAIAIIYLIMVIQFQSLLSPFIVMFTIPLAFTGGFVLLLVTGFEISIISMIGFIMLAGIIVNNGIVLVDYINKLRVSGMEKREAIVLACQTRMRPVLMTTLTTVLGLLFMAVGNGLGSELMQPIAITCIGGLVYGTLMTMFIVPALYDIFNRKEIKVVEIDDEDDVDSLDLEKISDGTATLEGFKSKRAELPEAEPEVTDNVDIPEFDDSFEDIES